MTNFAWNDAYKYISFSFKKTGSTSSTSMIANGYISNYSTALHSSISTVSASALGAGYDVDYYLVPKTDTAFLITLLSTAKSKQNTGYTSASWQALQTAITAADNLLATTGYTQAQVDEAKNNLQAALDGLTLLPDTSALLALLNQAKAVTNDGYNITTWQALQSAISSAQTLLNGTDYTATQVESAYTKLQSALDGLEYLPPVDELVDLLVEADAIEDIGYTQLTWNRFDTARYNGHALIASVNYTSYQVESTTTELRVSMNGLTLASIDPPKPDPDVPVIIVEGATMYGLNGEQIKYTDLINGVQGKHLEPVKEAIEENLDVARSGGFLVWILILAPLVIVIVARSFLNNISSNIRLDMTPRGSGDVHLTGWKRKHNDDNIFG